MPLYGRAYSLRVWLPTNQSNGQRTVLTLADSSFEPEALRVTFDVQTIFYKRAWYAEICVYNLDQKTTNLLQGAIGSGAPQMAGAQSLGAVSVNLEQGMTCELKVGYQNGKFGTIWSGAVFQVLFEREQAVDYKITLHCLLWLDPLTRSSISSDFAALTTQTALIQQLSSSAFSDQQAPKVSPNLNPVKQSRGGVMFGTARRYLDQIADGNNMQWFLDSHGLNLARMDDNVPTSGNIPTFSPPPLPPQNSTGQQPPLGTNGVIVGTPQQTQYGVSFRALLDPTVAVTYPAQQVKIDNSQIVLQKREIGEWPGILDSSGTYIVIAVRYTGDSRGIPWYIDVEGWVSVAGKLAATQFLAPLNGYH